ncbi:MAG TPA: methyltransferase domain-containing protein [Candidatus Dormibacteraeota bacterium]|nr:methyltransferase domain-containing protein [Candidatus Dormibacteraeota bacterium]
MIDQAPRATFERYVEHLEKTGWLPTRDLEAGILKGPQITGNGPARLIPRALRRWIKSLMTEVLRPRERRKAAALRAATPDLKLNLGCGHTHLEGWVNVDYDVSTRPDLVWDLRRPIPFPDGSAVAVFHEHLLEHIPLWAAAPFMHECRRLLRPGGVLRVAVPDFGRYARDYCGPRSLIESLRPGRPTALLALYEMAYCYEHTSIWDEETLLTLFREVGFEDPEIKAFGETSLLPAPERAWRRLETIYAEAVKR